eukprot:SAG11_NODE_35950_length_264_cov_0.630303_2_plen_49_part_01
MTRRCPLPVQDTSLSAAPTLPGATGMASPNAAKFNAMRESGGFGLQKPQ